MSKARKESKPVKSSNENKNNKKELSRRDLLKNAAGAVVAAAGVGLVSAISTRAQVQGSMAGGGAVPLRLPLGAMDHLDRHQYIHNMEIHSHLPGATITGGEPLVNMWAKGAQRLLPAQGGFVDISDGAKPVVLNTRAYQGGGSCVAYNKDLKKWIMLNSSAPPLTAPNPQFPHGKYDLDYKTKSTSFSGLRGIRTYDVTRRQQAEFDGGVQHRRKRQRHAHEFLRRRKIRLPRLRMGRSIAPRKYRASFLKRDDDR